MSDSVTSGPTTPEPSDRPLLRTTLGEVLRRTRLEQRRTLADVARAARVSMPYLSEVERGRKEASSEVLAAISDALRIELPDLITEVGRDMLDERAASAEVIRLDVARGRRRSVGTAPTTHRPGDTLMQAA
ncbi:helix-turn-helix protein [Haloactinopolyspora alba]|uniref:Helix-turn-helix protein n=1 Tax=Haloactinopolyspora alba TaxID=648780 RepID=A0A2P8DWK7_9ACTN|nr:helix-turn-helix transcriptional regulator [Haloactinopolyspora alba]PSL01603.1 helix-turn-helix protein [Haloactinopolyspora alba]